MRLLWFRRRPILTLTRTHFGLSLKWYSYLPDTIGVRRFTGIGWEIALYREVYHVAGVEVRTLKGPRLITNDRIPWLYWARDEYEWRHVCVMKYLHFWRFLHA